MCIVCEINRLEAAIAIAERESSSTRELRIERKKLLREAKKFFSVEFESSRYGVFISCPTLTYIPGDFNFQGKVFIDECGNLKRISYNPSIKSLEVSRCKELEHISNLENMEYLVIDDCPSILNIDGHNKLEKINVSNCHKLLYIERPLVFSCIRNCQSLKLYDIVIRLQRFWKRQLQYNKNCKIIDEIVEIYYQPGMKGYYFTMKHFEETRT